MNCVHLFGAIKLYVITDNAQNGIVLTDVDCCDPAWYSPRSAHGDVAAAAAAISVLSHLELILCIIHILTLHMSDWCISIIHFRTKRICVI